MFHGVLDKKSHLDYKNNNFSAGEKSQFSKGVNP